MREELDYAISNLTNEFVSIERCIEANKNIMDISLMLSEQKSIRKSIEVLKKVNIKTRSFTLDIGYMPMGAVRSQGKSSLRNPKKNKILKKYIDYKKKLKWLLLAEGIRKLPNEVEAITFLLPIPNPAIGSAKVRKEKLSRIDKPHMQKPDWDNLVKPIFDAAGIDDSHVWRCGEVKKIWTEFGKGRIIITLKEKYVLPL